MPAPGILPLTYDAADQVSGFTYDSMGRVTADTTRNYKWDLASRLTSYSGADGNLAATYDGFGMRTSATSGGVTRNFVWNYAAGLPSLATVKNASGDQTYYIYTPAPFRPQLPEGDPEETIQIRERGSRPLAAVGGELHTQRSVLKRDRLVSAQQQTNKSKNAKQRRCHVVDSV